MNVTWRLRCLECRTVYDGLDERYRCECGGLLDVEHDLAALPWDFSVESLDARRLSRAPVDFSGVWRFRELILPLPVEHIVTKPEGNTNLYRSDRLREFVGLVSSNERPSGLALKHEGENPTGSFKDRGMTVGVSVAHALGKQRVACASTGNTSASMAAYAAEAGMRAFVFIPEGKISYGKLSQALAYGATTIQIEGDFDRAMALVQQVAAQEDIYLLNSINPFRIEGQKAIAFELLQDLDWRVPDWIVLPGGNLGNSSAIAKGLEELRQLGWISRLPRLAVVQAEGANPFYRAFRSGRPLEPIAHAETIATAIKIGAPVSWQKSLRGIQATQGVVEQVTDQEILDAKAQVDAAGIGAEPASCATVAGVKKLVASGVIERDAFVCGILTGHLLKDPDAVIGYHRSSLDGIRSNFANPPIPCAGDLDSVRRILDRA